MNLVGQKEWNSTKLIGNDSISIKNIHLVSNCGFDIWGRKKPQPIDLSVQVFLSQPLTAAASADAVNESTIHYGNLSKDLTLAVQSLEAWTHPHDLVCDLAKIAGMESIPSIVNSVEVDLSFKKGSRYGDCAGLQLLTNGKMTSMVLYLKNLRIPALIGVNIHERDMKQTIIVSIWIDRAGPNFTDCYCEAEQIIEKTVEESSFETLESLAEKLASQLVKYFLLSNEPVSHQVEPAGVTIRLEKPSAVALADTPVVEIYRSALPSDAFGRKIREELKGERPRIPFPLQGRLDTYLAGY